MPTKGECSPSLALPLPSYGGRVKARVVLVVAAVTVVTAACLPNPDPADPSGQESYSAEQQSQKQIETPEVRDDVEPVRRYLEGLPEDVDVAWQGGSLGSTSSAREAPGPTDYWLDAVITLRPQDADQLRSGYDLSPLDQVAPLVPKIADRVPAGPQVGSPELDAAIFTPGKAGRLGLVGDTLVVSVRTM